MKNQFFFLAVLAVSFFIMSCSSSDDPGKSTNDPFSHLGHIKATVTYDSGESFEFNTVGNLVWREDGNSGVFSFSMSGQDSDFTYNIYELAVFMISLNDIDGPGVYELDEDSPHITSYDEGVTFGNVGAEASGYSPLIFDLGSGQLKIDLLNTERSKGSFEFELFLMEEPAGSPRIFDNPQNVQKVTIVGTYDKNVLTN